MEIFVGAAQSCACPLYWRDGAGNVLVGDRLHTKLWKLPGEEGVVVTAKQHVL